MTIASRTNHLDPTHLNLILSRSQSRASGRVNWMSGVSYERSAFHSAPGPNQQKLHEQALGAYQEAVNELERAKDSLGQEIKPSTYVPLAKSHLDVARELTLLHRDQEAREHIWNALDLLKALYFTKMSFPAEWQWRVYYLLGDVDLYLDPPNAAYYYQQAASINPNFVPAQAMIQYLGDNANTAPPRTMEAASTSQINPIQPQSQFRANTDDSTSGVTPEILSRQMAQLTPSKVVELGASALSLVAEIFEISELGPFAAAISLTNMIMDDLQTAH